MTDFEWNDSYNVGVKNIDRHNQYLLNSMAKVYGELNELPNNRNSILAFLDLYNYIVFHFASEEIWMSHSKYELVNEHSEQHRQIIRTFADINNGFKHNKLSVVTMLPFLIEMVITHIQTSDAGYGHFVNGKLSANYSKKASRLLPIASHRRGRSKKPPTGR